MSELVTYLVSRLKTGQPYDYRALRNRGIGKKEILNELNDNFSAKGLLKLISEACFSNLIAEKEFTAHRIDVLQDYCNRIQHLYNSLPETGLDDRKIISKALDIAQGSRKRF